MTAHQINHIKQEKNTFTSKENNVVLPSNNRIQKILAIISNKLSLSLMVNFK
jgi:hypothetical protein